MKHLFLFAALSPLMTLATTLSDGLVAHYKFDGNANDSSGNGNNGIVHGPSLGVDRHGNANDAYVFDGVDDWIEVANSKSLQNVQSAVTIAAWVKPTAWYRPSAPSGSWLPVLAKGGTYRQYGLMILGRSYYSDWRNTMFELAHTDETRATRITVSSDNTIALNEWQHWAVTFANGKVTAYINGEVIGQEDTSENLSANAEALFIGKDPEGNPEWFCGSIDDIWVYNRALSEAEVKEVKADDAGGLVAHYEFNGNANDSSGNGNNGVVHGPTLGVDRHGNANSAYVFDGIDDWIEVANSKTLQNVQSAVTIAAWVKPTAWYRPSAPSGSWLPVLAKGNTYRQYGLMLLGRSYYSDWRNTMFELAHTDETRATRITVSSDDTIALNEWQHWAVTFAQGEVKAYINGELVGQETTSEGLTPNTESLFIGKDPEGNPEWFCGSMDDMRVYNRALSSAEVVGIYNEEDENPVIQRIITFNANGGVCAGTSAVVENGSAVGTLPTATCDGYKFLGWFTSPSGGTQISETTVVTADATWYAHWQEQVVEPTIYTVQFNANGGTCARTSVELEDGAPVGTLPTATRDGYDFLGWFTAANGGTQVCASTVVTADVTWYAHWQEQTEDPDDPPDDPGEDDEPMDASIANTYDGVIVDADGLPMGYINVKTAKTSGKGDAKVSKATATIQMVGEAKKVTVKANVVVSEATMSQAASDGRVLDLSFSRYDIWGTFDDYEIEGVRNLLASTAKSDNGTEAKAVAEAAYAALKGNYVMAFEDDNGWNGLSVGIAAKGKVKVSGKLANGTSVATTSQLIVGSDYSVIPVIYTKKDTSLAFNIYFTNDGSEAEVFGYWDAVISPVGNIDTGLSFCLADDFYELYDDVELLDFLPEGVSVEPSGTKWIVADGEKKVGKIVIDKDTGDVYDKNESENPSGLKLTYAAKTGTFKGSFKVYYLSNGKLKSDSATITGFVVDGIGYGTVTVKKRGSASISIE